MVAVAAVFGSAVGQDSQQRNALLFIEGQHTVIEHVGRHEGGLVVVQFDEGHLGIGINEGLAVDTANSFNRTYVLSVLHAQVAGMSRLDFAMGLLSCFAVSIARICCSVSTIPDF